MSTNSVRRVTLFKVPKIEDQEKIFQYYRDMPMQALKDGKPYILSISAGRPAEDARAQGYNIAAVAEFKSREDFEYYDKECAAHSQLKAFARSVNEGFLMLYFEDLLA